MADLSTDLEAYATLAAGLADPAADRRSLLAAHGLDEAGWEALDEAWQTRIFAAEDDDAGVPALLAAYSAAFARAQQARAHREIPFERFLEATLALRRGTDMTTLLARLELSLDELLAAQARWTAAMLADEALAARFERAVQARG